MTPPTNSTARPTFARQSGERLVPPPPQPATPRHDTAAEPTRARRDAKRPPAGPPPLPPAPKPQPPIPEPAEEARLSTMQRLRRTYSGSFGLLELALVAGVAILAAVLRLRDPLSSGIMGAEDPYRHMERTWDLIQGKGIGDYPPGLAILMAPFALMGPGVFYDAARFMPVVFGLGLVLGVYALARLHLQPAGAVCAAFAAAVVPELVRRTNILFPTGIDLALVPLLFAFVLAASAGSRKALLWAGGVSLALLVTHPWVFVLVLPPITVYWIGAQARAQWKQERHGHVARVAMAAGAIPVAAAVLWFLDFGDVATRVSANALPRAAALAAEPSSITPLPLFVDFASMIGWPLIGLAALGAVAVLARPTRFGVLSLLYTAMLLPLILVDWFGLWYVPHRTVAYFAIGVCLLAGVAVSEAVRRILGVANPEPAPAPAGSPQEPRKAKGRVGLTVGALGLVAFLLLPAVSASTTWYRIYDDDDFDGWNGIADTGAGFVMAGSWQGRMGYRATTGNEAVYSPDFFTSQQSRDYYIQQHPDMVVLVDKATTESGTPTAFLDDTSQWTLIGQWGDSRAYARY